MGRNKGRYQLSHNYLFDITHSDNPTCRIYEYLDHVQSSWKVGMSLRSDRKSGKGERGESGEMLKVERVKGGHLWKRLGIA